MRSSSRLIKAALALTASALMFHGVQASAAEKPAPAASKPAAAAPAAKAPAPRTVAMKVTENGYEPSPLTLKKGEPVRLVITRTTDETCATELVMKDPDLNVELPLNKPVELTFTPTKSGQLKYGCAMGQMVSGVFIVE
jgi:plastocyanin domain-containing protein